MSTTALGGLVVPMAWSSKLRLMGASPTVPWVTKNPAGRVKPWLPGLVTVTLRGPTAAAGAMVRLAVSCVAELNRQALTVIPAPKSHWAPLAKLLPLRTTLERLCPWFAEFGLTDVITGWGPPELTKKPPLSVPVCASGLVMVTSCAPSCAVALMATAAVTCEVELNVHELTIIPRRKRTVRHFGNRFQ